MKKSVFGVTDSVSRITGSIGKGMQMKYGKKGLSSNEDYTRSIGCYHG